ncbi:hypothetical protein [Streptomyces sp. NRRL S-350]|uniref:hypothetical protein n=1 Tax=Streptomyces sp. NRRL S-350 TaxID=1463902 RepID=UPI0004BE8F58|nr:hypothetical protein [Streptomyces sp. NRRL S-350]
MAAVVVVHGIWNLEPDLTPEEAATAKGVKYREVLEQGLAAARLTHVPVPDVVMAYYAHLLTNAPLEQQAGVHEDRLEDLSEAQLLEAWEWLLLMGVPEPREAQAGWLAPVRQAVGWLASERQGGKLTARTRHLLMDLIERVIVAVLRDTDSYTSRPERRRAARAVVADAVRRHRPQVLVAHSLGSVVAWEALHAYPELEVELFVTLGSPLGLPGLARKLEPEPRGGKGTRPPGVGRWVNIADAGDPIALPPELGGMFPVDRHAVTDTGVLGFHALKGYLADGLTATAMAPYLSD